MGVGICSNATPVFQPQKFNVSTIGRYDTDEDYISQISEAWSSKRVCERNAVIFYKTYSQDSLKQQCDRPKYVPKHKMSKLSRKSSSNGPTFSRFQGLLSSERDKSASLSNHEILDEIWIATQEAQRKARGDNGTIPIESNRSFILSLADGESTDESLKVLGGEVFDVERSKRSRRKSSFPAIERESYIRKNLDDRLLLLMFYESDSSDSFDTS